MNVQRSLRFVGVCSTVFIKIGVRPRRAAADLDLVTKSAPIRGWFADPARRHEGRYWNGHGWTAFVFDGADASLDPLCGSAYRAARTQPRADFQGVMSDWVFRLVVTGESLEWQGESLEFCEVLGVTCSLEGAGATAWFETILQHRDGTLRVELPVGQMDYASARQCERAVASMLSSFEANLFPMVAFETAKRIFRGEPFAVGSVCVTSVGITKSSRFRTRTLTWNQFLNLKSNERELIVMIGKPDGGSEEFAAVPVSASNALLLHRVIESLLVLQMPEVHRNGYLTRSLPPGAADAWAVFENIGAELEREAPAEPLGKAMPIEGAAAALARVVRDEHVVQAGPDGPIGPAILANFSSVLASVAERDRQLAEVRAREECDA